MRNVLIVMVAFLVLSSLVGCGALRGQTVPINRDLTEEELDNFEELGDEFFILPAYGIFWRMKILKHESPGFRVAKVNSYLNPIPILGPGYINGGMADFNRDGTLDKTARSYGVKPFFSRMKVREFNRAGEPETVLTMTRVFWAFGGGKLDGERFGYLFVPIGVKRADIKAVVPEKISITKHLGR